MRTFDSNYEDWKIGDKVVWVDKQDICPLFTITEINAGSRWVFWEDSGRQGSQYENIMRVIEVKRDKTNMADLEKIINDLCELPSLGLEGNENINVRYVTLRFNEPFVLLEGVESIYLHPTQALTLLDYLGSQRQNLEILRDALQAKQIEEEAAKELRAAERLNALKALHSDAVVAWQKAGCEGPCPSFESIVRKEQFIRVDLDAVPATPMFVRHYPLLERMRKERQG
jgi:hypothetical protein